MENNLLFGFAMLTHFLIGFYFVFFAFFYCYHWQPTINGLAERGVFLPFLMLSIRIGWQAIAGFMIIFGFYTKIAAWSLIPFTLIVVLIFYPFWKLKGEHRWVSLTRFVTNMTITLGALLLLVS